MRKMLALDYGRVLMVSIVLFANDVVACFDRMVPNLSALVSMKYGVMPNVMISRNLVMSNMKYGVRAHHGDSLVTYCQEPGDIEIADETHDKADVACIWSLLSHTILKAQQTLHQGVTLYSANRKRKIERNNDAFVDDCDGVASKRLKMF